MKPTQTQSSGYLLKNAFVLGLFFSLLSSSVHARLGWTMQENYKLYGAVKNRVELEPGVVKLVYYTGYASNNMVNVTYRDGKSVSELIEVSMAGNTDAGYKKLAVQMSGLEFWSSLPSGKAWKSGDGKAVAILVEDSEGNGYFVVRTKEEWERKDAKPSQATRNTPAAESPQGSKSSIESVPNLKQPKDCADWESALRGKSMAEVREILGPPDHVVPFGIGYNHLVKVKGDSTLRWLYVHSTSDKMVKDCSWASDRLAEIK